MGVNVIVLNPNHSLKKFMNFSFKISFPKLTPVGCRQFHNLAPNAEKDSTLTRSLDSRI